MEIVLNWTNPNTGEDGTRIYRSTSPMDPENLPVPHAEVGPGVATYTDTDVVRYQDYYYRFGAYKGTDEALSGERKIAAMPYTGPGPQELIKGDMWAGYFGWVRGGVDFLRRSELVSQTGFTQGNGIDQNEYMRWWKFAWRNKILYIPFGPVSGNISWSQLYEAGLVYGVDGNGDNPTATPTNQLTQVSYKQDSFVCRLMKGHPDSQDSEWDGLLSRVFDWVSDYQGGENWDRWTSYTSRDVTHTYATTGAAWCQELQVPERASERIIRGYSYVGSKVELEYLVDQSITYSNNIGWWPVLELTPSV